MKHRCLSCLSEKYFWHIQNRIPTTSVTGLRDDTNYHALPNNLNVSIRRAKINVLG